MVEPFNPLEEAAIKRALKYFEEEVTQEVKTDSAWVIEVPKLRFRSRKAKHYPGWFRICGHCEHAQHANKEGYFGIDLHHCDVRNQKIEWPPSIGRNYA